MTRPGLDLIFPQVIVLPFVPIWRECDGGWLDDLGAIVAVDAGTSVEVLDVTDTVLDPASLTPKFLLPRIVITRVGGLEIKGSIIVSKVKIFHQRSSRTNCSRRFRPNYGPTKLSYFLTP